MAAESLVVAVGKPQLEMAVEDPIEAAREREREAHADHILFASVLTACRDVALMYGYDKTANALDAIWARHGRPVSPSFLRATLNSETETTRSYFRAEWLIWFARQSEEVAELLRESAGHGLPKKTAEEELADLKKLVRDELSHKRAEALIRKAETT